MNRIDGYLTVSVREMLPFEAVPLIAALGQVGLCAC